jgi:HK97 family phage prohead protease
VFLDDFQEKGMIQDVDMTSRTVTGYFSRFGNVDHDGDIIVPGAFTKSIKERGSEGKNIIPHILDHDIHDTLKMLSKPKLYEKADGGFFESTISDTQNGMDTLKLYRDGVINQHSFGFKITRKEDKSGIREIKEALIYEISTVPLGANEATPFTGFKSLSVLEQQEYLPRLVERYQLIEKCYRDGDYSDETFEVLKAQKVQLEQDLLDIFIKSFATKTQTTETTTPTVTTVTLPEVEVLKTERLNNIFKHLKVTDDNGQFRKSGAGGTKI